MQQGSRKVLGRFAGLAMGAVIAGSGLFVFMAPAYAATTTVHSASSYGAQVKVGSTVKLGPIAPAILPSCSAQAVGNFTASAASADLAPLAGTGAVSDSASSTASTSTGISDVLAVNLLGGVITANEIKSVSTTSVSGGKFGFSSAGSEFTELKVLGLPVSASPAPNTTIELPGIGSVILNEQVTQLTSDESSLAVSAIHVHVTVANLLGFAVGTDIVIANASSSIRVVSGPAAMGGYAESPQLTVGPVSSGPLVYVLIPCQGTYGAVDSDTVASASIPNVVTTGAVTATGTGTVGKSETSVQATTSIAGVNLLSGLLSATAVEGVATGTTTNGETFDFSGGATFVGLSVAGHPEITDQVAPNTKIPIAGLGTLELNRILKYSDEWKVVPVYLTVTTANTLGLAVGAELTLGVAEVQLHSAGIP
jgi:hypothetical protein